MRKDYEILGIDENADEKAIKRAYFKLIRTHSPEKDPERFQEIRAAYERLTEEKDQPENSISIEVPADDKFAESMYEQIHQLMQEREYGKAAQTAKEGMKYYQEVECFLYLYARCSILDGKPGNAVKSYEKLVKRFPDKLYYQSELAKAYHLRGYTRRAYTVFRQVYDQGWREIDFLNLFSLCCYAQKKCDEAVQVLENLIASINESRSTTFVRFVVAMDIPLIGRTASRILDRHFHGSLRELRLAALDRFDFTCLEGIGDIMSSNLHKWFRNSDHLLLWGSLQKELHFENGLDAQTSGEENNMNETTNNTFAGCTIVATGKLENFTRDGINAKIISLGATPGSSVTKKTDYLICGEKAGSKLAKAEQLGVKILTEQEFLDMLSA